MAGDSQTTQGGVIVGRVRKVFKIRGHLIGGCGNLAELLAVKEWFLDGMKTDRPSYPNTEILFVSPDGTVRSFRGGLFECSKFPYHALGSGQDLCMGALEMGATAIEAVGVACKLDINSSRPIHVVRLDTAG